MNVTKAISYLSAASIIVSGLGSFSEAAYGYHKTNRPEVERSLAEGGWLVIYSKEFSHSDMMKFTAALTGDAFGGSGSFTTAFLSEFAYNSVSKIKDEARSKAPQIADTLARELTADKLMSALRSSFNGRQVELSIGGVKMQLGRSTYSRKECERVFRKEVCVSMPNTYQPYVRFKVEPSAPERQVDGPPPVAKLGVPARYVFPMGNKIIVVNDSGEVWAHEVGNGIGSAYQIGT